MQIYLVGGAVRDKLLSKLYTDDRFPMPVDPNDRDFVVVGATIEQMLELGFSQVGHEFPVFLHPKTKEEYALARTERKHGLGYKGFICDFSPSTTLEEDLIRRDLTINAIAEDEQGNLIDPYGGLADLKSRVLRHVSPAFSEDPLRVLRVARFASRFFHLGFTIAQETIDLMQKMATSGELSALTPERVWSEMERALKSPNPEVFFEVLHHVGALKVILPELEALFGVPGPKRWHPEIDTFIHTIMTLHRIAYETGDSVARFAMLCHDLGKALTPKDDWPHHKNHAELGLAPLTQMCKRLKIPNDYYEMAKIVVLHHSKVHHIYRKGAKGIVELFDKLDAWRRPERIKPWILCCKCDFLGRKGFEHRPFPRADYIYEMFQICLTVKAKEFVEQGMQGLAIKEAMFQKRVDLINEFLKTLPRSEVDDSNNSLPTPYLDEEEFKALTLEESYLMPRFLQQCAEPRD